MSKYPRLLKEAADPLTPPERLIMLAWHKVDAVARMATRNASLPVKTWREQLFNGWPEAWDNPQAAVEFLGGWSGEVPPSTGARTASVILVKEPDRCSPEGRFWLDMVLRRWWQDCKSAKDMIAWLDAMSWRSTESETQDRRDAVRLTVQLVRDLPRLPPRIEEFLDQIEAWCRGESIDREKVLQQAAVFTTNAAHQAKRASERSISSAVEKIAYAVNGMAVQLGTATDFVAYAVAYEADLSGGAVWNERHREHLWQMADRVREWMPEPWTP